jgi:hypothetical protein
VATVVARNCLVHFEVYYLAVLFAVSLAATLLVALTIPVHPYITCAHLLAPIWIRCNRKTSAQRAAHVSEVQANRIVIREFTLNIPKVRPTWADP